MQNCQRGKEGKKRERMESWVTRVMAKIVSLRLGIWGTESYDKFFLYQKELLMPLFFVASFYRQKDLCQH